MIDPRVARLLDERELRRTAELYAQGADRANIVAALDVMARLYVATQHRVHNQLVTIDGDAAHGETYSTADHVSETDGTRTILTWAIRYQDRWRRVDGAWRFTHRSLLIDWSETRTLA